MGIRRRIDDLREDQHDGGEDGEDQPGRDRDRVAGGQAQPPEGHDGEGGQHPVHDLERVEGGQVGGVPVEQQADENPERAERHVPAAEVDLVPHGTSGGMGGDGAKVAPPADGGDG